jgi:hypothetical protein
MSKPVSPEVRRIILDVLTHADHTNYVLADGQTTLAVFEHGVRLREIATRDSRFPDSQLSVRFMDTGDGQYGPPIEEWHGHARHGGNTLLGKLNFVVKHTKTAGWIFWN